MRTGIILLSVTVCSLLAHSSTEAAEVEPPAGKAGPGLEEIIVTARKREESVLKVPVVETVLSARVLEQAQIFDIRGITTKVPGLLLGASVGSVGTQISLRGIGTSALDAGIDQSVSLNIDGQQFSQGVAFRSGVFDLAQAEVLRGPQALFFGKNSPGGVIALTTADPGTSAEVIARQSYEFEAEENRTELILSGPVTDTLGLRLAGSYSDSVGYFNNTATAIPGLGGAGPKDDRFGGKESYILRGTALWQPSSEFRARLKINATRDKSESPPMLQNVSCPNGTGPSVLGFQFIGGPIPCRQDENVELVDMDPNFFGGLNQDGSPGLRNGGVPFDDISQHFEMLDLSYDFPGITLSSTSTYYDNETDIAFNGVSGGAAGPTLFADNHFTRHDFTEEVRVQSDNPGAINWMLGGFYQEAGMKNRIYVGGNRALGLPLTLTAGSHDIDISSYSLFGQLRWMPIDVLELAAGVRYTDEERSDDAIIRNPLTGVFLDAVLPTPEISAQNWSPEVTATYTPTDTLTLFAAAKQGYKSGSYSITTPFNGTDNSFGDEKVKGGELGLKSRLLDRTLNLNVAAYFYKYSGLQVGVSQPTGASGVPVLQTLNAGDSETYGIDADTAYQFAAVPGLTLNAAVNWNKAKFISLHGVPCYGGQTIALGCDESFNATYRGPTGAFSPRFTAQDASGEPLGRAPEWQLVGGLDYEVNLSEGVALAIGTSVQYSSKYKVIIGDRDDYYQRSYTRYNGYLTIKDPQDTWELSLIGNNIGDVLRAGYCGNSDFQNTTVFTNFAQQFGTATNPSGKIDDVGCVVDPGRQIFLKLTVRPLGWM